MNDDAMTVGGQPDGRRRLTLVPSRMPRTRAECIDGPRPCVEVNCRLHLLSDGGRLGVIARGSVDQIADRLNTMPETCALDVVDEHADGLTLIEVGALLNLTRERIRQLEALGLRHLRKRAALANLAPLVDAEAGMHRRDARPCSGLGEDDEADLLAFLGRGGFVKRRVLCKWARGRDLALEPLHMTLGRLVEDGVLTVIPNGQRSSYHLVGAPDEVVAQEVHRRFTPEERASFLDYVKSVPGRNSVFAWAQERGWKPSHMRAQLAALVDEGVLTIAKRRGRVVYRVVGQEAEMPLCAPRRMRQGASRPARPADPVSADALPTLTGDPMPASPVGSSDRPWLPDLMTYLGPTWKRYREVREWLVARGMDKTKAVKHLRALAAAGAIDARGATHTRAYRAPAHERAVPSSPSAEPSAPEALFGPDDRSRRRLIMLLEQARARPDRMALLMQLSLTWEIDP